MYMEKSNFSIPPEEVFYKKAMLSQKYQISIRSVEEFIKFIRKHIPDRYPPEAQIHTGTIVRIRGDVFADAIRWKDEIEKGIAPEFTEYGHSCVACRYYRYFMREAKNA